MPLNTAEQFRAYFDIDNVIEDIRFLPHMEAASALLKKWIGNSLYDQVAADPPTVDNPDLFKGAEAYLTMYFALPTLTYIVSSKGIYITGREAEGKTTFTRYNARDTREIAWSLLITARDMINPYAPTPITNAQLLNSGSVKTSTTNTDRVERNEGDFRDILSDRPMSFSERAWRRRRCR